MMVHSFGINGNRVGMGANHLMRQWAKMGMDVLHMILPERPYSRSLGAEWMTVMIPNIQSLADNEESCWSDLCRSVLLCFRDYKDIPSLGNRNGTRAREI